MQRWVFSSKHLICFSTGTSLVVHLTIRGFIMPAQAWEYEAFTTWDYRGVQTPEDTMADPIYSGGPTGPSTQAANGISMYTSSWHHWVRPEGQVPRRIPS